MLLLLLSPPILSLSPGSCHVLPSSRVHLMPISPSEMREFTTQWHLSSFFPSLPLGCAPPPQLELLEHTVYYFSIPFALDVVQGSEC